MSPPKRLKPEDRAETVADWLAEGHTLVSARRRAREEWKLTGPKATALVNEAAATLKNRYDRIDRHELVSRVLATLEHTAQLALESGQLNTTVQALGLLSKIAALEPTTSTRK